MTAVGKTAFQTMALRDLRRLDKQNVRRVLQQGNKIVATPRLQYYLQYLSCTYYRCVTCGVGSATLKTVN